MEVENLKLRRMNPFILIFSFLIGVIAGLRCFTAPAIVSLGAYLGWINLHFSALAFLGSTPVLIIFSLLAIGELVWDKLPKTPKRTAPPGLIARFLLGGLSGMAIALAEKQSGYVGGILGSLGGVLDAFLGYRVRVGLVKILHVPDFVIAILEDIITIGGGLIIVSHFG